MAICNEITYGLNKGCENNSGGVNKIYVIDFANVTSITTGTSSTYANDAEWITSIGVTASTGTGGFVEIQTNKNVCNYTETVAIDLNNGTTFFNQVATIVLNRRETTKRDFITKLIAGQKQIMLIILDSNGLYWLFGQDEGCYVTAIEGGSGTAKGDANGYTVTITGMENDQAYQVNPAIISGILA